MIVDRERTPLAAELMMLAARVEAIELLASSVLGRAPDDAAEAGSVARLREALDRMTYERSVLLGLLDRKGG